MKIHLIAIGGSIMHNLALTLQKAGHDVTGSDDEIYDPARSRLSAHGLLPAQMGWDAARLNPSIDLVILGMHARETNPELARAHELEIPVLSFPAFVYAQSKQKQRVVVAGSHGKTTTTSMILHVLRAVERDFDYLVGAQLDGFETMVQLSDAPLIVMEGDEYLSSAEDRVPKIWHYRPQLSIITVLAWDHMNVFPTYRDYLAAFEGFLDRMPDGAQVLYHQEPDLEALLKPYRARLMCTPYRGFGFQLHGGQGHFLLGGQWHPVQVFGAHNMQNMHAAYGILQRLGVSDDQFARAMATFTGAAKRLQVLHEGPTSICYQDFAHAPSKVRATTSAVKQRYPSRRLTACVELHTYSSFNKQFMVQYAGALDAADQAVVYFSKHTLKMKKMPPITDQDITASFGRQDLMVFTEVEALTAYLQGQRWSDHNLLLMSSGTFGGLDHATIWKEED